MVIFVIETIFTNRNENLCFSESLVSVPFSPPTSVFLSS